MRKGKAYIAGFSLGEAPGLTFCHGFCSVFTKFNGSRVSRVSRKTPFVLPIKKSRIFPNPSYIYETEVNSSKCLKSSIINGQTDMVLLAFIMHLMLALLCVLNDKFALWSMHVKVASDILSSFDRSSKTSYNIYPSESILNLVLK